jgi:hypothetical protein
VLTESKKEEKHDKIFKGLKEKEGKDLIFTNWRHRRSFHVNPHIKKNLIRAM